MSPGRLRAVERWLHFEVSGGVPDDASEAVTLVIELLAEVKRLQLQPRETQQTDSNATSARDAKSSENP